MINVTKTFMPPINEYLNHLNSIWSNGKIANGGELLLKLNDQLKNCLNVEYLSIVGNGTLALQLSIKAHELKGEIITTPYSYVATTNSILWQGCIPKFVDIDRETYCINPELIEEKITENTSAILATHVYGYPCDIDAIKKIASKYNLVVIYDAAHAFGATIAGKSLASYGDCSILSFHATKLFHSAEGGAIVVNDKKIHKKIELISRFGHEGESDYVSIGINAKMSELNAAMGLTVLPYVDKIIEDRKSISSWYDEMLNNLFERPKNSTPNFRYNYAYYPILFSSHTSMMLAKKNLEDNQIFPRRYFFPSLNTLPFLDPATRSICPVSEEIAGRVLCLPLFYKLSKDNVQKITKIILESNY